MTRTPGELQRPPLCQAPSPEKAVRARLARTVRHADAIRSRRCNRSARATARLHVRQFPFSQNPTEQRRPTRAAGISTTLWLFRRHQIFSSPAAARRRSASPCLTPEETIVLLPCAAAGSTARWKACRPVVPAAYRSRSATPAAHENAALVGFAESIHGDGPFAEMPISFRE